MGIAKTAAVLLVLLATPATAFTLDLSSADLRRATQKFAVEDLSVGEIGIVNYPNMCVSRDSRLFLGGQNILAEAPSEYSANIKVQRGPANSVALTIENGSKSSDSWQQGIIPMIRNVALCDVYASASPEPLTLLEVTTINGKNNLSELLHR